jgi:hypothetical protein
MVARPRLTGLWVLVDPIRLFARGPAIRLYRDVGVGLLSRGERARGVAAVRVGAPIPGSPTPARDHLGRLGGICLDAPHVLAHGLSDDRTWRLGGTGHLRRDGRRDVRVPDSTRRERRHSVKNELHFGAGMNPDSQPSHEGVCVGAMIKLVGPGMGRLAKGQAERAVHRGGRRESDGHVRRGLSKMGRRADL